MANGGDWKAVNAERLAAVHPVLRERVQQLLDYMEGQGVPILVTDGYRSYAQQMALWCKGRNMEGTIINRAAVVTMAPPGLSMHNYGLAVDLAPDDLSKLGYQLDWNAQHPVWTQLLQAGLQFNLAEGAQWRTFQDRPHFYPRELPANPTDQMRRLLVATGGVTAVWKWADTLLYPPTLSPSPDVNA